ncbi:MAG: hypothetical protein ACXACY_19020 [Candidatus Hodarchaeales archaeon]|jgi:hypothetical protein
MIHYKPYIKFTDFPSREPDNPIFLRDLDDELVALLVESIYSEHYSEIFETLLPEQLWVLRCHATFIPAYNYPVYSSTDFREFSFSMNQEICLLAKQEIEPGMFKDEDTLYTY